MGANSGNMWSHNTSNSINISQLHTRGQKDLSLHLCGFETPSIPLIYLSPMLEGGCSQVTSGLAGVASEDRLGCSGSFSAEIPVRSPR